jgi:hypothetical protein
MSEAIAEPAAAGDELSVGATSTPRQNQQRPQPKRL